MSDRRLPPPAAAPSPAGRLRTFAGMLGGLCGHDLRAAATLRRIMPDAGLTRLARFVGWSLGQMWTSIPDGLAAVDFPPRVERTPCWLAGRNRPSRFINGYVLGEMRRWFGPRQLRVTHEWSGTAGFTRDEYPIIGTLDGHRQHIVAGMCGAGSGVSFNAGRCIVNRMLGRDAEDDHYPPDFFAPSRILDHHRHPWPDGAPPAADRPAVSRRPVPETVA